MARMRRIQVLLEAELDDRLEREAGARGLSKSGLVRACVRDALGLEPFDNGLLSLAALGEGRPDDSATVDELVYGR